MSPPQLLHCPVRAALLVARLRRHICLAEINLTREIGNRLRTLLEALSHYQIEHVRNLPHFGFMPLQRLHATFAGPMP
jgi:hypothetical protein